METKNIIDKLTKNVVFKELEEEAYDFYSKNYKETPLELLFSSKKDLLSVTMLSTESFKKSITIYYCLLTMRSVYKSFKLLEIDKKDEKNAFKSNSKYIDYLFYNKEIIEIKELHKVLSSDNFSIKYLDIFNYFILNRLYDQNSYKKLSEFIIFLISKIDDLKMPFYKKWGSILLTFNSMSITYVDKTYDDSLNLFNISTVNKIKPPKSIFSQQGVYSNMFTKCGPLNSLKLKLKSSDVEINKEADEFFISIINAFIKYIYNLTSLKNEQYEFFKYLIENDLLFRSDKKYKKFYNNIKIGTLSTLSNFDAMEKGFKAHKSNLKIIKTYLNEFNKNSLDQLKKDGDILTYITLNNYFNDFNTFFNKYLEKINKITIKI